MEIIIIKLCDITLNNEVNVLENVFQIFGMANVFQEFLQLISVSPCYSFFVCQINKLINIFHKNTKIKPTSIEISLESTFLISMKFHQIVHKKQ